METFKIESLDGLSKIASLQNGTYVLEHAEKKLSFELSIVPDAPLLVFLHGAKTRKVRLPWFVGAGMSSGLKASRISISDPSLEMDEDLSVAWYAGSSNFIDLPQILAQIISIISRKLQATRTVLIGGSAGGFAAMSVGALLPGSIAFVWNPQTRIEKYYKRFVDNYQRVAWNGERITDTPARNNLVDVYSKPTENVVLYLQCSNDLFHVEQHLAPFRESAASSNRIYYYVEDWAEGHTPPPKSEIADWINFAASHDFENGFAVNKISR